MENITDTFRDIHLPFKGIIIYKNGHAGHGREYYVEAFDFAKDGKPLNFHPLSTQESLALAETLYPAGEKTGFLHIRGILPKNVLHIDASHRSFALWYTGSHKTRLFFKKNLDIPCGIAYVPPLLWLADKRSLSIFALKNAERPTTTTKLYHAPFFNVSLEGDVCLGDIDIDIADNCGVTDFMTQWEKYFFSSYFSHLIGDTSPVTGNIIQLWQMLVATGANFPLDVLRPANKTIKNLLE